MSRDTISTSVAEAIASAPEKCGRCEYCLDGRENLCPKQDIAGETVNGGFAEFIVASEDFTLKDLRHRFFRPDPILKYMRFTLEFDRND